MAIFKCQGLIPLLNNTVKAYLLKNKTKKNLLKKKIGGNALFSYSGAY